MNGTTKTIALLLMAAVAVWSCNGGKESVKAAENEVFAIHDEIMPKVMGDLVNLKKELSQRVTALDSVKANGSAAAVLRTDEEKEQAIQLNQNLTVADSLMNHWMAQYNGDTLDKLPSDQALYYLTTQKDIITDVKTKVNTSIEQARQFLGKK